MGVGVAVGVGAGVGVGVGLGVAATGGTCCWICGRSVGALFGVWGAASTSTPTAPPTNASGNNNRNTFEPRLSGQSPVL